MPPETDSFWMVRTLARAAELMIEQLSGFPDTVVAFSGTERITRDDYVSVVIPAVDAALKTNKQIRLYYEIGPKFESFEPTAAWEDFKVGMEHIAHWQRVAVVTDVEWIKHTMQIFSFLMPGDMRVFPTADKDDARRWIATL